MNLADLLHAASWMYRWNSPGEYLCGAMVQEVFAGVQEIFERKQNIKGVISSIFVLMAENEFHYSEFK